MKDVRLCVSLGLMMMGPSHQQDPRLLSKEHVQGLSGYSCIMNLAA